MQDDDSMAQPGTSPFWQRPGDDGPPPAVDAGGHTRQGAPRVDPRLVAGHGDSRRDELQLMGSQWLEHCTRSVRERPMASLGAAALAGFLLARLTGRR